VLFAIVAAAAAYVPGAARRRSILCARCAQNHA